MLLRSFLACGLLLAIPVFAQNAQEPAKPDNKNAEGELTGPTQNKAVPPSKRWYNIPLPMVGTSTLPPQQPGSIVQPMTPKEKAINALKNTFGIAAIGSSAYSAAWNQLTNSPEEWHQGWEAYGKRVGYSHLRQAARNTIMLGFDVAMHTDQRYDRCVCDTFWSRTGHAGRRIFIARTDSGGERVNVARLAASYGAATIAYRLYPPNYHGVSDAVWAGSTDLAVRLGGNIIREFWPEIHRLIKIGPHPTDDPHNYRF